MDIWEYKVYSPVIEKNWLGNSTGIDAKRMESNLNLLGKEGWELVSPLESQTSGFTSQIVLVLKRRKLM